MKKICSISRKEFEITSEDLAFYEKMDVPPPTLCPEERMRRRLAFRNMSSLYHRTCAGTGKKIISCYSPESPCPVYENEYWWSDEWDAKSYGRDFDFSRPFFEQFRELLWEVPKMARVQQGEIINSQFTNCASYNKNCYLLFGANKNEDCLYGNYVIDCRSCLDVFNVRGCEISYWCLDCTGSYDIQFCQKVHHSNTMRHCSDCQNCANCFACVGLRNKQQGYFILNEKVTKEEFERVMNDSKKQKEVLAQLKDLYLSVPKLYTNFLRFN